MPVPKPNAHPLEEQEQEQNGVNQEYGQEDYMYNN
jgi:hypothetical protein